MAINGFTFQRRWTNPEDFPTFETDEAKVRADMQALFDELAAYLNYTVVPRVNADADGLQAAQDAIDDLVAGTVPDGSLTAEKFSDGESAGWELLPSYDLEPTVATVVDGTTVTGLTLANWEFHYSRSLGVMAYSYQLDVAVTGATTLELQHSIYRSSSDTFRAAGVFGSTYGLSANAACRDVTNQGYTEYRVNMNAAYSGSIYVSGWYFCDGPGEEEDS